MYIRSKVPHTATYLFQFLSGTRCQELNTAGLCRLTPLFATHLHTTRPPETPPNSTHTQRKLFLGMLPNSGKAQSGEEMLTWKQWKFRVLQRLVCGSNNRHVDSSHCRRYASGRVYPAAVLSDSTPFVEWNRSGSGLTKMVQERACAREREERTARDREGRLLVRLAREVCRPIIVKKDTY